MAACTFNLGHEKCVSELQKVTRDDLYGSRRVQALGADNKPLQRAGVLEEGNLYLVSGDVAGRCAREHFTLAQPRSLIVPPGRKRTIPSSFKPRISSNHSRRGEPVGSRISYRLPDAARIGDFYLGTFNYRDGVETQRRRHPHQQCGVPAGGKLKKPLFVGWKLTRRSLPGCRQEKRPGEF
jgi:hypothetical protein